jgi:hypothetical protein
MRKPEMMCLHLVAFTAAVSFVGCANYRPLQRPVPQLSVISPNLADLSEQKMEKFLTAEIKQKFPCYLAVAKVQNPNPDYMYDSEAADKYSLDYIQGDEARGWQGLKKLSGEHHSRLIAQVRIISPALLNGNPSLRKLRDAAAVFRAPILLVYVEKDAASEGFNDNAPFYWTGAGVFFVPGNTVGYHAACQAVLIDTRTGAVLATADSESRFEQKVPLIAAKATREKAQEETRIRVVTALQKDVAHALTELDK